MFLEAFGLRTQFGYDLLPAGGFHPGHQCGHGQRGQRHPAAGEGMTQQLPRVELERDQQTGLERRRHRQARQRRGAGAMFEHVLAYANDLGLFAEEIDPDNGMLLGNFPQAFTHVGLIDAALTLARAQRGKRREPGAEQPQVTETRI